MRSVMGGSFSFQSIGERARDDFAHVVGQVGLGGDAGDGLACGRAVGLGQLAPAIERARRAATWG